MSLSERIRFILSDGFAVRPSCAGGDNEEAGQGIMLLQEVMNLSLQDLTGDKIKLLQDSFKKLHAKNEALQKKLDLIEQELQCAVCYDTVQEPETTPCGHVFCGECLYNVNLHAFSSGDANASCPTCRDPILSPPPFPSFVLKNIAGLVTPPLLMAPNMPAIPMEKKGNQDDIKTFLELYYRMEINGENEIKTNFLAPLDNETVLDRIIRKVLPDENDRTIDRRQDPKMEEMYTILKDTFNTYVKYHKKQKNPKPTLKDYISDRDGLTPSVGVHFDTGQIIKLIRANDQNVLYKFFVTERNPTDRGVRESNIIDIDWPVHLQEDQFVEMVAHPKFVGKITKLIREDNFVWYEVDFPMLLQAQSVPYSRDEIRLRPDPGNR